MARIETKQLARMLILRKEWNISYTMRDGEGGLNESVVVLPSFLKVLWWFLVRGRKACNIYIWVSARVIQRLRLEDLDADN